MPENIPKYLQIYNNLLQKILIGDLKSGDYLPTETELMKAFSAGRNTVRHAVAKLQEGKYIKCIQGSGSLVLPLPVERMQPNTDPPFKAEYRRVLFSEGERNIRKTASLVDIVIPPEAIQKHLQVEHDARVYKLTRLHILDGLTIGYHRKYLRMELFSGIEELDDLTSVYHYLHLHTGLDMLFADEYAGAAGADAECSTALKVPEGAPLWRTIRISFCELGPFEVSELFFLPDYHTSYRRIVPNP